ncbi:hypothetical protein CR513_62370, partial [Mucuna pruriens]
MAEQREDELCQQIAMMKATSEKRRGGAMLEVTHIQPFWGQPFSEEIDGTPIPPNFREIVVEPFDGTQDPHAYLSIYSFNDLTGSFVSKFVANRVKQPEVADLFDIKQAKGESLKSYLACFNNATIQVDDPDQKFFVKAFQKGLRAGQFSDVLALRRPSNMEEIRTRAKKHVEAEEDQAE